jgi:hydroxymethylbilane synthase
VRVLLEQHWPEREFQVQIIRTQGDVLSAILADSEKTATVNRDAVPLSKGLFTGELESALMSGQIDLAIHSLKDLPTDTIDHSELEIAAIPQRADPHDVVIYRNEDELARHGAILATGSPRRVAQLQLARADREVVPVRGNIDTRLRKLRANPAWAGLVLAKAGLDRLGPDLAGLLVRPLTYEEMLPAPGQGALALQIRRGNGVMKHLLKPIHHATTAAEVGAERAMLRELGGGCQQPIAAIGRAEGGKLLLEGIAWLGEVSQPPSRAKMEGLVTEAEELGKGLARVLRK